MKDVMRENLSNGQNVRVYLVVHFAWKEQWPELQVYSDSWAVTNYLAGWMARELEGHNWKFVEEVWR